MEEVRGQEDCVGQCQVGPDGQDRDTSEPVGHGVRGSAKNI